VFENLIGIWFRLVYETSGLFVILTVLWFLEMVIARANKKDEELERKRRDP
jgi:hypothetical protein